MSLHKCVRWIHDINVQCLLEPEVSRPDTGTIKDFKMRLQPSVCTCKHVDSVIRIVACFGSWCRSMRHILQSERHVQKMNMYRTQNALCQSRVSFQSPKDCMMNTMDMEHALLSREQKKDLST